MDFRAEEFNLLIRCSALLCIGFFIVGILSFFHFSLSLPPFFCFFPPSLPLGFPRPARRTSVGRLNKPYFIATVIVFVEYSTAARLRATSRLFSIMCVSGWGGRARLTHKGCFFLNFFSFLFFPAATLSAEREVWRTLDGLKRSAFFFLLTKKLRGDAATTATFCAQSLWGRDPVVPSQCSFSSFLPPLNCK